MRGRKRHVKKWARRYGIVAHGVKITLGQYAARRAYALSRRGAVSVHIKVPTELRMFTEPETGLTPWHPTPPEVHVAQVAGHRFELAAFSLSRGRPPLNLQPFVDGV